MWAQVSFVLSQCTCLTDRQTDRRKGLCNTVALHYMQSHGKNETFSYVTVSKTSQDYQFSYNKMQKYQNDQKSKFIEAEDQPNHINEGNKLKQ